MNTISPDGASPAYGVDMSRVAEVVATYSDKPIQRRGSGFLLASDVVLTAWHAIVGAETVRFVFEAGTSRRWTAVLLDAARIGDSDIALVRIDHDCNVEPVTVGQFGDRGVVLDAHALGFPRWKIRPYDETDRRPAASKYRAAAHVPARLVSGANTRDGACELIVDPPAADPDPDVSPWVGMSGGPVFCGRHLVGVVTDHHRPEGLGRLSAVRLDLCLADLSDNEAAAVLPMVGLSSRTQLQSVWRPPGTLTWAAYQEVVRDIAPREGLRDRESELLQLAHFCAGPDYYSYWQGPTKAGKSALMATFALQPPTGVTVVSFFITARLAGQSDSTAFTDALLDQLCSLLGETVPHLATPLARQAHWRRLLTDCASKVAATGGRLVLLVDGLDEDTGAEAGSTIPSIASLLPRHDVTGLKVIVAGRPDPPLPPDVQATADHPLLQCQRHPLTPSTVQG